MKFDAAPLHCGDYITNDFHLASGFIINQQQQPMLTSTSVAAVAVFEARMTDAYGHSHAHH